MRLLCFFGSGISKPSGMPMTGHITAALFSGKWQKHTNSLFYPLPEGIAAPSGATVANLAQGFLQTLKEHAVTYLQPRNGGETNYEHLFSLTEIIKHDVIGARLRPEAGDFVEKISKATDPLWQALGDCPWSGTRNNQLASLTHHAIGLIQGAVRQQLGPDREAKGLQALRAIISDTATFEHVDLVTLNHDLLLESVVGQDNYCDGFVNRDRDVQFYADDAFKADKRINLLKPHGSINWYRFRKHSGNQYVDHYGKPDPGKDPWHLRHTSGAWLDNLSGDPVFLTGVDKLPKYATGIFANQVAWFRRFLEKTDRVVCSGYGWRDDGMNNMLFQWLDSSSSNRVVLLHDGKNIEADLLQNHYSPWSYRSRELLESRQLVIIPKWLCCCKDATEIISAL
jgi:hypothetical protein